MNDDGSFQVGTWAPGEHFEDFLLMKDAAGDWHEAPMPAVGGYGTIPDWARAIKFGFRPRAEYRHLYAIKPPAEA